MRGAEVHMGRLESFSPDFRLESMPSTSGSLTSQKVTSHLPSSVQFQHMNLENIETIRAETTIGQDMFLSFSKVPLIK